MTVTLQFSLINKKYPSEEGKSFPCIHLDSTKFLLKSPLDNYMDCNDIASTA